MTGWMDTQAASEYSGMSPRTITNLCRTKRMQHGSDGRHYKLLKEHIDAYLMANGFDGRRG